MDKRVKNAIIFAGGVGLGAIAGGVGVAYKLVTSKTIGRALAKVVLEEMFWESDKVENSRHRYGFVFDFDSRKEAEDTLDKIIDVLETYDVVTVADVLDILGQSSGHQDDVYGWVTSSRFEVYRTNNGYRLSLPKPSFI